MKEEAIVSPLRDEIIYVRPIKRNSGWLSKINENHDGAFLYTGCHLTFKGLVYNPDTLLKVDPLTAEERAYFESPEGGLGFKKGDLDINKREDNFWTNFLIQFDKFGGKFDLSVPIEYIKWKFALSYSNVFAKSKEDAKKSLLYKFYMEVEGEIRDEINNKAEMKENAYLEGAKLKKSAERMRDFLFVYGKRVGESTTIDTLKSEVNKIIENEPQRFLDIITHSDFDITALLHKSVSVGIVIKSKHKYSLPGGDIIGHTTEQAVDYLKDKNNSDIKLSLKAQLSAKHK